MKRTWTFFDLMVVLAALAAGFGVWFLPDFEQTEDYKALTKGVNERKAILEQIEAEKARVAREREELGLVYLPPPPPPAADASRESPRGAEARR